MTVTQEQIQDALADFQALVADGWSPTDAIDEAAKCNQVKPEALRYRLENNGGVDTIVAKIVERADRQQTQKVVRAAIEVFAGANSSWIENDPALRAGMLESVASALGRPADIGEAAFADKTYKQIRDKEIDDFLNDLFQIKKQRAESLDAPNQ